MLNMIIVQIEHEVSDFPSWRKAFDNDPIDGKKIGVHRYSVLQLNENRNYIIIELEFEDFNQAEAACSMLKNLWSRLDGSLLINPNIKILHQIIREDIL
jgi:hypothetical protein